MDGHLDGGIFGLYQLIDDHGRELEFDLLQVGVDLLDLWRGSLSWRRLAAIVSSLPPSARTVRAIHSDMGEWSDETWLLHRVASEMRTLRYVTELANTKKSQRSQVEKPQPLPYPGMPKPEVKHLIGDGTGRDLEEIKRRSAQYNS